MVQNVACTHGHPKAFVGSLFHASCLALAIDGQRLPSVEEITKEAIPFSTQSISAVISVLGDEWLKDWDKVSGLEFAREWQLANDEITKMIESSLDSSERPQYREVLAKNGLLEERERGSATKTAAAAVIAIELMRDFDAYDLIHAVVMALDSDTDSIATMVGAIIGATGQYPGPKEIQDRQYLLDEADRVASGKAGFPYGAIKSKSKPIVVEGDTVHFGALGDGTSFGNSFGRPEPTHRWYNLSYGQTILLHEDDTRVKRQSMKGSEAPSLFTSDATPQSTSNGATKVDVPAVRLRIPEQPGSIEPSDVTVYARKVADGGFDHAQIGRAILSIARARRWQWLGRSFRL